MMVVVASAEDLKVGDRAPDFHLPGSDGLFHRLSDYRGKQAVAIAWFPKAFTGGCTKECISMRESGDLLRNYDVAYFTASCDTANLNRDFAESLSLDYPILSDTSTQTARHYGVVTDKRQVPFRWTFIIGKDGRIKDIIKRVSTSSHGADIATRLGELGVKRHNRLSAAEEQAGWKLLFDGSSLNGWKCNNGKPIATKVELGALVPFKSGGYIIMHEDQYDNFVLRCDVKMSSDKCNSGIFFRVSDPAQPVQRGFEAQVMGRHGNGRHDFGAIYDLATTSIGDFRYDDWNQVEIKCYESRISVRVNGEKVSEIDTNDYPIAGRRPDGTKHKFGVVKDLPYKGYLGFQDHGHKVWYRNVKLLEL